MNSQAVAAIIAFFAGVIVTSLSGWFGQRIEQRKHVIQLSSTALIDAMEAIAENQQCEAALTTLEDHASEDEKIYWRRRVFETRSKFYAAKARIAAYGNSESGRLLASIERKGGVTGDDSTNRQLAAEMVLSFRKQLGFKKNDLSEKDAAILLFGPTSAERERQSIGWPRPAPESVNREVQQQDRTTTHHDNR